MKTSELEGAALDWAVAKCEGNTFAGDYPHLLQSGFRPPMYSCYWEQGGPIIERERLCITATPSAHWNARTTEYPPTYHLGPTPLIAAMRCYVASKLGAEVEVPDDLA